MDTKTKTVEVMVHFKKIVRKKTAWMKLKSSNGN